MARTQTVNGLGQKTLAVAGTAYQIYSTSLFVKSIVLQAALANTGTVTIMDSNLDPICELAPGFSVSIYGDQMDNGTTAKIDVSTLYAKSTANNDKVTPGVLENL